MVSAVGAATYAYVGTKQPQEATQEQEENLSIKLEEEPKQEPKNFKQFSGEEFKEFFLNISYPNTQVITDPPVITGNKAADDRIRDIAESRGYRLSVVPVAPIVRINEPMLDSDDLLQPLAAEGWASLKQAATDAEMPLSLSSAYRSPQYQRELFMQRLLGNGVTVSQVADGLVDDIVDHTLTLAAIPGYSRHHTGYTIDLWCKDGSAVFLDSICFEWMMADNYQVAKEHGWIPSYPEGADMQGPEPEPWEYVWVGRDSLLE